MMLSVVLTLSGRYDLSPAKYLIPISYVSILAGTTTLIGTSTNIIVSQQATTEGLAPLGMFELARVAIPVAAVGGLALYLLSNRLLPGTRIPIFHDDKGAKHKYLAELVIPSDSVHVGEDVVKALQREYPQVMVHEVFQGARVCYPERDSCTLAGGDVVLLSATAGELVEILGSPDLALPLVGGKTLANPYHPDTQIFEAIVTPDSHLLGRRIADTFLGVADDIMVIGAQRRRVHLAEGKLKDLRLRVGDILLVQCGARRLQRLRTETDLMIIEDSVPNIVNRTKAPLALGIFVAMVGVAALGVVNILTASLAAAFLMVLSGCMRLHEAYEAVEVSVLVLIIGTIALGTALSVTGAADLYARAFLSLFQGAGPHGILAALIVLTSALSHVLSNNSTAVLLVPIGVATAAALNVDPRPFIIGVCFGASACFASPIGYQTNLLVFGPGGYRFVDYLRLGMVLNLIVWTGASLLIPRFWAF
jgi:di/tricarboxylate transporter